MRQPTPRRLLIVDDDAEMLSYLSDELTAQGYLTATLESPLAALERVKREDFDIVIADVEMPGLRGVDLMSAILGAKPRQLVLLITAFGSIDLAVSAVKAGACDFIAKPFKIEVLLLAIERALRERQMEREIVRLRSALPTVEPGELVAKSPLMLKVLDLARKAAKTESTVLLTGETGTGKTVLAHFIHRTSSRAGGPFQQLNCAALPANLVESELFGVKRGAFTDAKEDRAGVFATAEGGTLLLDEVGELPLEVQAKLLHTLESGRIRPVGSSSESVVKTRVLAATNTPLEALLRDGRFRPDLYYRLNVIRIEVPPLRERKEDIVPLVDLLLRRSSERCNGRVVTLSAAAMKQLVSNDWPGNVRELANTVERAVALTDGTTIEPEDLDFPHDPPGAIFGDSAENGLALRDLERVHIQRVLDSHRGNKAAAARTLGVSRRTLYRKIES